MKDKIILAIETSCDETAVAVMQGNKLLSNALHSQIDLHKKYGGVVPGIAKLAHIEKFDDVFNQAVDEAGIKLEDIDYVAVTRGLGLAIALEVGINKAKELATKLNVPLLGMSHMAGHLFSALMKENVFEFEHIQYPNLGLLVSGGHTAIVLIKDLFTIEKIGESVDDAAGEAYDKFAMMLGLEYPGGPMVSKLAAEYAPKLEIKLSRIHRHVYVNGYQDGQIKYSLPIPMASSGDLNMSYSGLKTAVKQLINELSGASAKLNIKETGRAEKLTQDQIGELCVMFEAAALNALILKLEQAIKHFSPHELWLGGGVSASPRLQTMLTELAAKHNLISKIADDRKLLTDNAGMIAAAAFVALKQQDEQGDISCNIAELYEVGNFGKLDRVTNLSL